MANDQFSWVGVDVQIISSTAEEESQPKCWKAGNGLDLWRGVGEEKKRRRGRGLRRNQKKLEVRRIGVGEWSAVVVSVV